MSAEQALALTVVLAPLLGGLAGWFARGRQREIATEDGALGLYRDALAILDRTQALLSETAEQRDAQQGLLMACVNARDKFEIALADAKLKIAELEQRRAQDAFRITEMRIEVDGLKRNVRPEAR